MSRMDESQSPSGPEARPPFGREAWRELNAAQLVCIAGGTVSGFFSVFAGLLLALSAIFRFQGGGTPEMLRTALLPSGAALLLAAGAVLFTRSGATRRAAWQESSPAVLMALTGLLGVVVGWLWG